MLWLIFLFGHHTLLYSGFTRDCTPHHFHLAQGSLMWCQKWSLAWFCVRQEPFCLFCLRPAADYVRRKKTCNQLFSAVCGLQAAVVSGMEADGGQKADSWEQVAKGRYVEFIPSPICVATMACSLIYYTQDNLEAHLHSHPGQ